jgi:hypothetical protein
MTYINSNESGRLMDADYEAGTEELLRRERLRHEAASRPRHGFDAVLLLGKYPRGNYETAQERQTRELAARRVNRTATDDAD